MVEQLLRTQVAHDANATTLSLRGEIDLSNATELAGAIDHAIDHNPHTVVIDLAGVTFCDSSGLKVFVLVSRRCARRGVNLRIVRPNTTIAHVFDIAGLGDLLEYVTSLQRHGTASAGVTWR